MKTIVLSNLKQVFETIMTLCNILQLRVLSHNKNIVVYSDLFNDEKIIILNKEYSEVIYHDYTNNVHVTYEINNSEKLFIEYYNRCDELNKEIETMTNESIEQIDYLNNRIETLKKEYNKKMTENYDLTDKIQSLQYDNDLYSNQLDKVNNKLAYYESEYQDIVAEKMQQSENRCSRISKQAVKIIKNKKDEINQLNNIISDRDMVISTMTKRINHLHKVIRQMKKK